MIVNNGKNLSRNVVRIPKRENCLSILLKTTAKECQGFRRRRKRRRRKEKEKEKGKEGRKEKRAERKERKGRRKQERQTDRQAGRKNKFFKILQGKGRKGKKTGNYWQQSKEERRWTKEKTKRDLMLTETAPQKSSPSLAMSPTRTMNRFKWFKVQSPYLDSCLLFPGQTLPFEDFHLLTHMTPHQLFGGLH